MIHPRAILLIILFVFISCDSQGNKTENLTLENKSIEEDFKNIPVNKVTVVIIDGCEYIFYKEDKDTNSSYGFMAHKGNCSNPIHACN